MNLVGRQAHAWCQGSISLVAGGWCDRASGRLKSSARGGLAAPSKAVAREALLRVRSGALPRCAARGRAEWGGRLFRTRPNASSIFQWSYHEIPVVFFMATV